MARTHDKFSVTRRDWYMRISREKIFFFVIIIIISYLDYENIFLYGICFLLFSLGNQILRLVVLFFFLVCLGFLLFFSLFKSFLVCLGWFLDLFNELSTSKEKDYIKVIYTLLSLLLFLFRYIFIRGGRGISSWFFFFLNSKSLTKAKTLWKNFIHSTQKHHSLEQYNDGYAFPTTTL